MRTLYFDCFSGASGNMILGALIDLGIDVDALSREVAKLGLEGVSLKVDRVNRSGISAPHVEVLFPEQHHHRHLSDIEGIIDAGGVSEKVKKRAKLVFRKLAEAEARVHGIPVERVHFHEVGAVDAIVDIVGACICFEMLKIDQFASSRLNTGSGFTIMDHGKFPVPPPAVAELAKGFELYSEGIDGELLTPTGAAIITTVCAGSEPLPPIKVEGTGYGAGTKEFDKFPNVLRLVIGESGTRSENTAEKLVLIETNIDDATPQLLGYVMEEAFEAGALDCWFTPIHMKKNRPAAMLSVLAPPELEGRLKELLFRETPSIGVRVRSTSRECLERSLETVETRFGPVEVKTAYFEGKPVNAKPEFDQMKRLAKEAGVPLKEIEKAVDEAIRNAAYLKAKG